MKSPQRVSVDELLIPSEYQRPARTAWVKSRDFDIHLFETLTVSKRADGKLYVIGGQQRLHLARKAGLQFLWAYVFEDLTIEQEAQIFWNEAKQNCRISAFEAYRASLLFDPNAQALTKLVQDLGYKIMDSSKTDGCISAVNSLAIIYSSGGGDLLKLVLSIISEGLDKSKSALEGFCLLGLSRFIQSKGKGFDKAKMVRKLRMLGMGRILAFRNEWGLSNANSHGSSAFMFAFSQVYSWHDRRQA